MQTITQRARDAYAELATQEAAHEAWKASLKPVPQWAVVKHWERQDEIDKHHDETVGAARARLTAVLVKDSDGDYAAAIDQLMRMQNGE